MNFINPLGFLFALFIPGVILLYLLKQEHEDVEISSTYLWEKTLQDIQASKPWQKLRKNILLILQIAALLLFTFTLARPFISTEDGSSEYIIVLDCSASMQAEDIKPSRFEKAKNEIEKVIDGLLPGEHITLIQVDNRASTVASNIADKTLLRSKLKNIKVSNKEDSMKDAISLADAVMREREDANVHVYTDKYYRTNNDRYNFHIINGNGQNTAVTSVSYAKGSDNIIVLSKITNYGDDKDVSLECLVDGQLRDIKEVIVKKGQTVDVYWNNVSFDDSVVEIDITDQDALMTDNKGWVVLNADRNSKALMITNRNVFLEKAVNLRSSLELVKTTYEQAESAEDINGYDLYILDGYLPDKLPKDGNIIIINPPEKNNSEIAVKEEFAPQDINVNMKSSYKDIMKYVKPDEFHVAKAVNVDIPSWSEVVMQSGDSPILAVGEKENQRIAVFTFDLHNSDIPLKPDFPILVQNILSWMLPDVVDKDLKVFAGEDVVINPLPDVKSVSIKTPSGNKIKVAPPFPVYPFSETDEVGVYTVMQELENESLHGYFTVNIHSSAESNILASEYESDLQDTTKGAVPEKSASKKRLWYYFAWAALALILIEWWVYQRGY